MQAPESIRFADLEIRPGRRQVLRAGAPLALGTRAFDLLLALAARPGHVQTKDELLDAVWNGAPIGENNLVVQVAALRRALGPEFIATLPGRGYQWTGGSPLDSGPLHGPDTEAAATRPLHTAAPDLVGRDSEFAWLQRALAQRAPGSVVSVVGPAGIGKTALARALAASLLPMRAAARPCTVELSALAPAADAGIGPVDTAALAAAVGAALGARPGARRAPLDALQQHVAHRAGAGTLPPLLVLDNGEHVHAALRQVTAALAAAAPALPLLVTSQLPLNLPQERVLRLAPLDLPDGVDLSAAWASGAVSLFCLRAVAADPGFELDEHNVAAVIDICRRLDGVALALELAAGRVALLGVDGLRGHLDERFRLLRSTRDGSRARHHTLQAALDWSVRLLQPTEQVVLRRLSVFAGGFTAASVQAVASDTTDGAGDAAALDRWAVLDALGALLERSLVSSRPAPEHDEPRLGLLESVRAHARQRLQASGEALALGRRHAGHFLALAESHGGGLLAGTESAARRSHLARELDNLRAAMAWCIEHDPRLGLRLAAALALLWRESGLLSEGRQACAALLERTPDDPPGATRMAVQVTLGALAMEQDDAAQMQAMGEQVLQASRALGDRRREAHAQGLLAHAAAARNDLPRARAHFEQCLAIYRAMGEPRTIAESLNNLAQCRLAEGRCDLALALVQEALPLARASGHAWTEAALLQTAGDVRHALGELDAAEAPLAESLRLRREHGHAQQIVMSLQSLALLALRRQQPEAARLHLVEATAACALHGFGQLDGLCLLGAGAWAVATGREADAGPLLAAACRLLHDTPVGSRPHVRRTLDEACDHVPGPTPDGRGDSLRCSTVALEQALALLNGAAGPSVTMGRTPSGS
ncbi:MAG: tetratricopeptide repeat protein [Rubrivivax sp.]